MELILISVREHRIHDVGYILSCYRSDEGHVAFWQCRVCIDEGGMLQNLSSPEIATEKCVQEIERHHAERHVHSDSEIPRLRTR